MRSIVGFYPKEKPKVVHTPAILETVIIEKSLMMDLRFLIRAVLLLSSTVGLTQVSSICRKSLTDYTYLK